MLLLYIGVDLGTSGVKLLLLNERSEILRTVTETYPISYPHPGWSEQNPEDWLEASKAGIRALLSETDPAQVEGLCFSGQMHGLVILDEQDRVIRPAILWNDGRTGEETAYLNREVGTARLDACCANIAFAGFTAPKLLWLRRHEPESFARISKVMLPKDYLTYKFTGVHCTDPSDASGMLLFDVRCRQWSAEMLELVGLRREAMAQVCESGTCVGTILPGAAAETGLSPSVRVAAGAGDNAAAAIGTGVCGEGGCNISLGTSGTIFLSSTRCLVDPNHALHSFAHADGGYHLLACMLSAASCNKWWVEDILRCGDYAAEQAEISRLGENSVFFLPYLMGERSPHNDPDARAAFLGMSMDTTRADMTQAVLEGVAFGLRDSLEAARSLGLEVRASSICGGGAKSALWRKITANILNLELHVMENDEGPALGSALLAATACGVFPDVAAAAKSARRIAYTVYPEPELAARYAQRYGVFRRFYPALRDCQKS